MSTPNEKPAPALNPDDIARNLEQLSELATLVLSARDALSDDIVTRVSSALSEGITLLDRLTRNEGLMRLLQVLDRPEMQYLLKGLGDALTAISREVSATAPARGGLGEALSALREPGTMEGLRVLSLFGKHLSESLRELHHRGGG